MTTQDGDMVVVEKIETLATGLEVPDSPHILDDGSVLLSEIPRGQLTRIETDGNASVAVKCGGGPNASAFGPDGLLYLCNDGGYHDPTHLGYVQRIDLETGAVETIYEECEGNHLRLPKGIAFDPSGNFWFSDMGNTLPRDYQRGGVYYASPDGSMIREVVFPVDFANGIGLAPDGSALYWAESMSGRLQRRAITEPGVIDPGAGPMDPAGVICGLPGLQLFNQMRIDPFGNVCVATLVVGRITVVSPDGSRVRQVSFGPDFFDPLLSNLCFRDDGRALATLGRTGRLIAFEWPFAD
jgi:gluconolactonase